MTKLNPWVQLLLPIVVTLLLAAGGGLVVYGAQGQELADLHEKVINLESRLHDVEGRVADKLDTAVFYEAIALHDERQIAHDQEFLLYIKEDLARGH